MVYETFHETYKWWSAETLKWNSRQNATKALFVIEYESNLQVNA